MDKNMIIINEIMSCKNASSIILTKSDGEHIGFMADLIKNYRRTFWVDAGYDCDYDFPVEFAERVLGDAPLMNRLIQFGFCPSDFSKDIIIVNAVLDYISKLNCDCLLIIDRIEALPQNFDLKILESILQNCPKNLKIVLVSDKFPELNYSLFLTMPPKLIGRDLLEAAPFDENIFGEKLSDGQWKILYTLSLQEHLERNFLQLYHPEFDEIVMGLSLKYKSSFLQIGSDGFIVNPRFRLALSEKFGFDSDAFDLKSELFDYYCRDEIHRYVKALIIALEKGDDAIIDEAVGKFVGNKKYICNLRSYLIRRGELNMRSVPAEYKNVRLLLLLSEFYTTDKYCAVAEKAKEFLSETDDVSPIGTLIFGCMANAMYRSGKKKESADETRRYIGEKFDKYGEKILPSITEMIEKLPNLLRTSNIYLMSSRYKTVEKYLMQDCFSEEYWYLSIMQGAVGCNLDMGYFKRGIEYLNKIKTIIPFYVVPHNLITTYFFAGDMELAKNAAEEIIYASKWNGVVSNLTDAYVLLGLINVYYNKNKEAIDYLNEAVKYMTGDEYSMYKAISVRALVCAETGMAEYAKDITLLYAKRCEINGSKYTAVMEGTAAYCFWTLRDKENAQKYATKCVVGSTARSAYWLICTAIMINYLFENDDARKSKELVEKFLTASKNYGMEIMSVVCYRLFAPILDYAAQNNIEPEYLALINEKLKAKNGTAYSDTSVSVRFFGTTSVSVGGKELIWKTKKAKGLFLLYILRGAEGIDRNEIIDIFWGDYVYISAINNLKTTNNLIRNTLAGSGIKFKLEYSNSKYSLYLENKETDYDAYNGLNAALAEETDLRRRVIIVSRILNVYGSGFVNDIKAPYFNSLRDKIKDELGVTLMQTIRDLVKSGETIEAKRYVSALKKLQGAGGEYLTLLGDIDRRLLK